MKFNINNCATVTLTKLGAKAYNDYYKNTPHTYRPEPIEEGYVLKDQLWHLFRVFGECIALGRESPFKECIMEFDKGDFSE